MTDHRVCYDTSQSEVYSQTTVGDTMTVSAPSHRVDRDDSDEPPRVGVLGRLADASQRRRGLVLLVWIAAVVAAIGLSAAFAGPFKADYTARGSESRTAQDLLGQRFP